MRGSRARGPRNLSRVCVYIAVTSSVGVSGSATIVTCWRGCIAAVVVVLTVTIGTSGV